jgi:UDP-N-acetylmuramyl pentapeptide phosphotransferase/UDP-N-acetylglucosamine-1-phosphate transferase
MSDITGLVAAALVALVLSVLLTRVVMTLGLTDAPTEARKIQTHPVPTSGGLGFAPAALLAAFLVSAFVLWRAGSSVLAGALGALPFLVLGFLDDRLRLDSMTKLIAMVIFSLALVLAGVSVEFVIPAPGAVWPMPVAIAALGSVLWLVVVINAVNFMDGANGLSMGMGAIASLGLAVVAAMGGMWDVATLLIALSGALAGFLVWNVPGRLFAGDAGALFTGAILAGASLLIVKGRPDWLLVPPTILAPWLVDVLLTLIWRGAKGKPIFSAHRDHVYQIAMKAGLKHSQVSAIHAVWATNAAALGVMAALVGGWAPLAVFTALVVVSGVVHTRVRKSGEKRGLVGKDVA